MGQAANIFDVTRLRPEQPPVTLLRSRPATPASDRLVPGPGRLFSDVKLIASRFPDGSFGDIRIAGSNELLQDFLTPANIHRPWPEWPLTIKRIADVIVSAAGLVALSPLLLIIAAVVWLDSPGPVFYRGVRVGHKGQKFNCCKFRTMVLQADLAKADLRARNEREGAFFKIAKDPRITRAGQVLRRYSLDELPQLWNVLCGEMSLVGPRPHPPDDVERYRVEQLQRLDVVPGITGLWQVTARRDPSFERSVSLDVEYIQTWSLGLDLRILWKTIPAVFQGGGA